MAARLSPNADLSDPEDFTNASNFASFVEGFVLDELHPYSGRYYGEAAEHFLRYLEAAPAEPSGEYRSRFPAFWATLREHAPEETQREFFRKCSQAVLARDADFLRAQVQLHQEGIANAGALFQEVSDRVRPGKRSRPSDVAKARELEHELAQARDRLAVYQKAETAIADYVALLENLDLSEPRALEFTDRDKYLPFAPDVVAKLFRISPLPSPPPARTTSQGPKTPQGRKTPQGPKTPQGLKTPQGPTTPQGPKAPPGPKTPQGDGGDEDAEGSSEDDELASTTQEPQPSGSKKRKPAGGSGRRSGRKKPKTDPTSGSEEGVLLSFEGPVSLRSFLPRRSFANL
ncbi:hypothetical protein K466DRAFT_607704 [Polyporus arcularius HHB13444]|uniref:Uncharacterized protein n=1 Tax=Polyporus arcularius HHB13444 TaxID=1314778 RepID=A0A5C3NW82_9APHY|nr:hypothetical protein K466DRAFT_607704 [Polyporus arcularius HHB13444]